MSLSSAPYRQAAMVRPSAPLSVRSSLGALAALLLAVGASVVVHVAGLVFLILLPEVVPADLVPPPVELEMVETVLPPEPEPAAPPEPAAEPAPAPPPEPPRARAVPPPTAPPPPTPAAPPPPAQETVADFTGVTLTNEGDGPGWASVVGNGQDITAPLGRPNAVVTGRNRSGVAGGAVGGTGTGPAIPEVPLGDLTRAPRAPDLNGVLERYYPREARLQGIEGRAVVRARIKPDGSVDRIRVVSESEGGFGQACRQTLDGSRWSAPIDRNGRPVATEISYTCRFEVRF